jgi:hypothetical protein
MNLGFDRKYYCKSELYSLHISSHLIIPIDRSLGLCILSTNLISSHRNPMRVVNSFVKKIFILKMFLRAATVVRLNLQL